MYDQAGYAMKSEQIERAAEESNQIPRALKQLEESVAQLDHQAGRLLDKAARAMQPEETAMDAMARLDSVPRMPVAPLASQIEDVAGRVSRIADLLASGANRIQL